MDLDEQYDKIYRYCYYKVGQRERAEDITQETFLRFLENGTYQNRGKQLQYLYTIARNLCVDEYRKKQYRQLPQEWEEAGAMDESLEEAGAAESGMEERVILSMAVKAALEELGEEDRELVLLRYVNQVPAAAVCSLFSISRFALYRRSRAVLKQLRERLEDYV